MKKIFLILFSFYFISSLAAQSYYLLELNEQSGLPSNNVLDAVQDQYGLLWIATDNGLVKFDGENIYPATESISNRFCHDIHFDGQKMWVTHDAGISTFMGGIPASSETIKHKGGFQEKNNFRYPNQMIFRSENEYWVSQTGGTVSYYAGGALTHHKLDSSAAKKTFKLLDLPKPIAAAKTGEVYVWEGNSFKLFKKFRQVDAICKYQGNLLVAEKNTLYIYSDDFKLIDRIYLETPVDQLYNLDDKSLMVVLEGQGLFKGYLGKRNLELSKIFTSNNPKRVRSFDYKNINNVLFDQDNIFVCSKNGLAILTNRFFKTIPALPSANTVSIGTWGDEVYTSFGNLWQVRDTDQAYKTVKFNTQAGELVTGLHVSENKITIGTSTGMIRNYTKKGALTQTKDLSERGDGIFMLHSDQSDRLWFCQAPKEQPIIGVGMLQNGILTEYDESKGLYGRVLVIKESKSNQLFVGGIGKKSYLYRYNPVNDNFINLSLPFEEYVDPSFEVHDLAIDDKGIVWLATSEGLFFYDYEKIIKIDLGTAFMDVEVRSVVCNAEQVWFGTDTEGVFLLENGKQTNLLEASGLPSKILPYRSILFDKSGKLWVGTAEGLALAEPPVSLPKANIVILKELSAAGYPLTKPYSAKVGTPISIDILSSNVHGAPSVYQWKVEGGKWSPSLTNSPINIEGLDKSTKTILIRSQEPGCSTWSEPLVIPIKVTQVWYKSILFLLLVAGLLLFGIYRFGQTQVRKQVERLWSLLRNEQKLNLRQHQDIKQYKSILKLEMEELKDNLHILRMLKSILKVVKPSDEIEDILAILLHQFKEMKVVDSFYIIENGGSKIWIKGYKKDEEIKESSFTTFALPLKASILNATEIPIYPLFKDNKSGISVPFNKGNKSYYLILFSSKDESFDLFDLETIIILTLFLEQK